MSWATLWPVAQAVLVLGGGWLVLGWLTTLLGRILEGRVDPAIRSFLLSAARPVMMAIVLLAALDALGVKTNGLLAAFSAAGLAVAMALKDSLSNAASGAILLTLRPFSVGDRVVLPPNLHGRVTRLGLFATELELDGGSALVLTNDKVLAGPIERRRGEPQVPIEAILHAPRARYSVAWVLALRHSLTEIPHAVVPEDAVLPREIQDSGVRIEVRIFAPPSQAAAVRTHCFDVLSAALGPASPAESTPL